MLVSEHYIRGLSKDGVIDAVASFGGDANDVRMAMVEGLIRIGRDKQLILS